MTSNLDKYIVKKKAAEKKVKIGGPLIIVGILVIVLLIQYPAAIVLGAAILLFGGIYSGIGGAEFSKLSKQFKVEVLTGLVSTMVDNGHFDANRGLSKAQVYSTEFLKQADRFHAEDYLSGSLEGVEFVSSDVKLEERHVQHTKNGTRTYYETYFLGRVFIFDFNKSFEGYIHVLEQGRPTRRRGAKKVKLESVAFNKKFRTFSTSDHAAFYVLTPHFMEALMRFEQENKGHINFSFIDNNLFIGINNFRDTFELKMFRKLDERVFDEFKRDLMVIKDVITELKLNRNIFKKGV